ncbi:hypothetical protein FA13DRAFT_1734877 [Coprinellus micaceus]|uniref:Uncharacterized protein n=1 Tax=Coprinellus micaceus TaxID=71717 RepID=A0A4Y7T6J1_COPMI|nr:hypothetical protein FA13DRAFT_1734877 [Coprinellus micaceus]
MQERTGAHAGEKTWKPGAFETLHGIGENIRGSTLGAVDAVAGDAHGQHDEIAWMDMHNTRQSERMQYPTSGLRGTTSAVGTGASRRDPPPTNTAAHHHRDDAISGLPSPQTRDLQGRHEDQRGEFRRPQYD